MSLASFAVKRYQFTLVLFALLIALGIYAFRSMPRAADPSFPIPVVSIIAVYPGTDPSDMEALVTDPIEDAIAELDDVKTIFSSVKDGLSVTRVEFSWDVEAEKKYDEAIREMNSLRPSLPAGLSLFEIQKANPNNVKIVQFALISDGADALPAHELRKYAERLETALETAPGIKQAEYWGLSPSEVQITLDPKRVKAAKLSLSRVIEAVRAEAQNVPGGAISISDRRFNLKTSGDFPDVEAVGNTIVASASGQIIRLKDVATVTLAEAEQTEQARFNGRRAVFVAANQKAGQNIFKVQQAVAQRVKNFERSLPKQVELVWGFDQSVNVAQRLDTLGRDFMIAIALVMLTLLPLGTRAAGVVMVSIPLSLAVGLACMYFAGFSLNQLSIAGFVIALGLLVDDSIVVVENIERHLREGKSPRQAAIEATDQISLAVLGCTATLILAFLPLMFLPEGAGKFVRNIPASVLATVTASLFVSLTIVPFLASRVLRTHANSQGNALLRWLTNGIHTVYTPLMKIALGRPKATLLATVALFFASLALVPKIGFSLFPLADTPQFLISIETPDGSSLDETDRVLRRVEAILQQTPEIKHQFGNLGRGNRQIFYNVFPRDQAANYAEIYAELKRYQPDETPKLFDQLRVQFANIAGARIIIKPFENGPPIDAPIAIRVSGPDLNLLSALAKQVTDLIEQTEGTRDVLNPIKLQRTNLALNIDAQKAGLVGVSAAEIDRTVRLSVAGLPVANYRDDEGDEYPIVLRLPLTQGKPNLDLLQQIEVNSQSGESIPLKQFIDPSFDSSPTSIQRYQRARSVMITAYTGTGYNTGVVTNQILAKLDALELPRGYRWQAAGEVESREDSFSGIGAAILIAVFGIMAVLILEFGSFKSMLVVAGVIPLGIVGGLVALLLSGYSLSFTASIGFIALIGIEIKNSILLVDFTNQLRAQGMPLLEAIERAGEVRFLPILLTSLTAIGGLLPLALAQAALYSPMAWVMIGGLISSTLLARLVTPVMYVLLPPPVESLT